MFVDAFMLKQSGGTGRATSRRVRLGQGAGTRLVGTRFSRGERPRRARWRRTQKIALVIHLKNRKALGTHDCPGGFVSGPIGLSAETAGVVREDERESRAGTKSLMICGSKLFRQGAVGAREGMKDCVSTRR